jgi:hypothetical protein
MRLNRLFCGDKTSMKIMIGHSIIPIFDSLHQVIILFIQTIKKIILKFFRTEGLTNRRKCVRELLDLLVVNGDERVRLLDSRELCTNLRRMSSSASSKTTLKVVQAWAEVSANMIMEATSMVDNECKTVRIA